MELGPIVRAMLTNKPRFGLIAMQVAITLAIVANCVALILDASVKMTASSGFDDEYFIHVSFACPIPENGGAEARDAWFRQTHEELRQLADVQLLSVTSFDPWQDSRGTMKPASTDIEKVPATEIAGDEALSKTIGLKLDEGRWFSRDEVQSRAHLVIVTRAFGRRLFGDGPLVGKQVEDFNGDIRTIIGVVSELRALGSIGWAALHGEDGGAVTFIPMIYTNEAVVVRVDPGKMGEVRTRIETYLERRSVAASRVATFSELQRRHFAPERLMVSIMGVLAFVLLFIASLGIAGHTSFSVTERTRQIGVRRALGASTNDILGYFLTESGIVTTLGLVIGSSLAFVLNAALLRIYDSAKISAPIVTGSALLLWIVALGAALPPALRASRISPAIATRNV